MNNIQPLIEALRTLSLAKDNSDLHIDSMIDLTKQIYQGLFLLKSGNENESRSSQPIPATAPDSFEKHIQQHEASSENSMDMNEELEALFSGDYDKTVLDGSTPEVAKPAVPSEETIMPETTATEESITIPAPQSHLFDDENSISLEFPSFKNVDTPAPATAPQPVAPPPSDEEKEADNENVIEKISRAEETLPTSGQGFKAPSKPNQKDFRTHIGFNDRYLFLNELFNNNKELFDNSISKINNATSYDLAKEWIDEELAANLHWEQEDSTVETFYALIEKYFNTI